MVAAWSTAMFWEVFAHPCKCKLLLKLRLCYAVHSLQRLNITHFIHLSSQWLILHVIWYSLSHILLHFIPPLIVRPIWKSLFIILQICRWFTHASGTRGLRHGWFTVFIHKWRHFWQIWVDTIIADIGVATGSASFTSWARTWSWCRRTTWPSSKATWVDTGPVFSITTPGS